MRRFWLCLVACNALWIHSLGSSYALDVTLAWDANTELDLAGYLVYYDTDSGDPYYGNGASEGDSPVDLPLDQDEDPDPRTVQFTLHDFPEGTYFFAVTAYNSAGLQSGFSNEASVPWDELSAANDRVSTTDLGGTAGGGGGCFVATAACTPDTAQNVAPLSQICFLAAVGLVAVVRNLGE